MEKNYRNLAIEHFWRGEDSMLEAQCRGAQVISYLKKEIEVFDEVIREYNETEGDADVKMRGMFVEVLNYIADCTENEDMRVEEE